VPRHCKPTGQVMAGREAFGGEQAEGHGPHFIKGSQNHCAFGNFMSAHRPDSPQLVGELKRAGGFAQYEVGLD